MPSPDIIYNKEYIHHKGDYIDIDKDIDKEDEYIEELKNKKRPKKEFD